MYSVDSLSLTAPKAVNRAAIKQPISGKVLHEVEVLPGNGLLGYNAITGMVGRKNSHVCGIYLSVCHVSGLPMTGARTRKDSGQGSPLFIG